ncbi:MAG: mycofactocin precursor [Ilumatobacter sp.]|nr:mycofactocin precursor [Ilumatobacter sp.]
MSEPTDTTGPPSDAAGSAGATDAAPELIEEELLVEEISIDGMCGVY